MQELSAADINHFSIVPSFWGTASTQAGQVELYPDGAVYASLLRDLPPALACFPECQFHAVSIPLDMEVYKEIELGDIRFSGQLRRGDIAIIPAGCPSRFQYEGRYGESLNVFISPQFIDELLCNQMGEKSGFEVIPSLLFRDAWLTELGSRIRDEIVQNRPGGRIVAESLATAFVVTLARTLSSNLPDHVEVRKSDAYAHRHVKKAIDYIHDNLDQDISLQAIANAAGCNLQRLKHAFKDHVGEPPYRYVMRMRIERGRHLLAKSRLPISEVARQCGFNDQAHFTTAFARLTGMTPAKWRQSATK